MINTTSLTTVINVCLGLFVLLSGCSGNSAPSERPGQQKEVLISDHFYLEGHLDGLKKGDTITLSRWEHYIHYDLGRKDYTTIAKDGVFSFAIEAPEHLEYFSLDIQAYDTFHRETFLDLYHMAPGDSIHLKVLEAGLQFSGRGSEKYSAREAMDRASGSMKLPTSLNLVRPEDLASNLAWQDSVYRVQNGILEGYKARLTEESYLLLHADILGKKEYDKYFYYWLSRKLAKSDTYMLDQLSHFYQDNIVKSSVRMDNGNANAYSRRMTEYLILKERVDRQNGIIDYDKASVPIKEEYLLLKDNYKGRMQGKLLTNYLANKYTMADSQKALEYCFEDFLAFATTPYFREIISKIYQSQKNGALAYNFSLPDTKGDVHHLEDYRGKLVFLDFWFTGCTGCLSYARKLVDVHEAFKDNPDVVFMTISIDKDRQKWIKSVEGGKYTSDDGINLFTGGSGYNHPLIEHYDISSYPYPMIIDRKGRVFRSTGLHVSADELIEIIEDALKEET